ncbi:MFS transporter [Streptomyces sp. NBC_00322]|uniref:MFS transporter n=1 Tax=Streptomyces sp. NBC_00322 TaxID=2975712 RepID=UPI002E28892A|nr:MFS transporter [Streptomyces sp. NBC_00322]
MTHRNTDTAGQGPASATQVTDGQAAPARSTAASPWRTLPIILVGSFMAILDTFIVLVAAPAIQADLHASDGEIQLIVAGYQVTYAVALITGARLGDMFGRKRLFMLGMALFTLTSVACALAPTAGVLIAARLAQGLSAALMFPQVFSMIQVLIPAQQRHRAFGALGSVIGVSTVIGQLVGGLLIAANLFGTTWRPVFWVNVPIGLITLALAARMVPETRAPQARSLDLPGLVVLTVALFLLVVPLVEGRDAGWPAWTWASLVGSAAAFALLVVVERRVERAGRAPLVSLRLFAERPFAIGITLVVVAYAGVNSFFLILSLMLQDGLGMSALGAGLAYTPLAVAFFATSLLAARWTPRYGRRVLELGSVLAATGFLATLLITFAEGGQLSAGPLIAPLALVGLGNGLLLPQLLNTVLSRIDPSEIGMASGVLSTGQQVGGAVGVAVVGMFFFDALPQHGSLVARYAHAFGTAAVLNLAIAAIATALLFALPRPTPAEGA